MVGNDGTTGYGFGNTDVYERVDGGYLEKKDKYKIDSEEELVSLVCSLLEDKGVKYTREFCVRPDNTAPVADIHIPAINTAVECKNEIRTTKMVKALGQCTAYRHSGYRPVVLIPEVPSLSEWSYKKDLFSSHEIPVLAYDPSTNRIRLVTDTDDMNLFHQSRQL